MIHKKYAQLAGVSSLTGFSFHRISDGGPTPNPATEKGGWGVADHTRSCSVGTPSGCRFLLVWAFGATHTATGWCREGFYLTAEEPEWVKILAYFRDSAMIPDLVGPPLFQFRRRSVATTHGSEPPLCVWGGGLLGIE